MLVRDLVQLSVHNLLLHKVRSFLTSLGIIFGVGSVISMLAISEGAKTESLSAIASMGIDNVIVTTKKPSEKEKGGKSNKRSRLETFGITDRDYNHIKGMGNIRRITTMRDIRQKIFRGTQQLDLKLVAVSPGFLEDSNSSMVKGRWFSKIDEDRLAQVCVIGSKVKRKYFGMEPGTVVGKNVRVGKSVFRVVGVLDNDNGASYGKLDSPNDMIFIPSRLAKAVFGYNSRSRPHRWGKVTHVEHDVLIVKVADTDFISDTADRMTRYLGKTHPKVKDWGISVPLSLFKQKEKTQKIFTIVMASIAGISLIVGGVGSMNIMLANIYERRREIGTRRALGAKRKDILYQFLVETVSLTTLGGFLGVALGLGISQLVTHYAGWPIEISPISIALSLAFSSVVGVVFGTYPAMKAARQNPIDVLRAE